jgi:GNAT superfamily N-acetyltransferase
MSPRDVAPVVRLREMTQAEYDTWRARLVVGYADEKVASGAWAAEGALERSEADTAELLPDGLGTADMLLFTAEDAEGEPVGMVWLALRMPHAPEGVAWVCDIEVVDDRRGQGYGRELLAEAEDELRARGVPAVGLNVHGSNPTAMQLYATSGYRVTAQQMRKELG